MTTTTVQRPPRNGVDIPTLFATLDAVKGAPQIAQFQFRATQRMDQRHPQPLHHPGLLRRRTGGHVPPDPFTYDADHPAVLVGIEPRAHAGRVPAACHRRLPHARLANIAAARGITLRRVSSTVEGDIDLLGILGLSDAVRNGYRQIRVHFDVDGDASPEQLSALVEQSRTPLRRLRGAGQRHRCADRCQHHVTSAGSEEGAGM